jgi:hypothetical protein
LCNRKFSEVTAEGVVRHVRERHGLPSKSAASRQIILPVNRLLAARCRHCTRVLVVTAADAAELKRELRPHRELHKDVSVTLKDCFKLKCRLCGYSEDKEGLRAWSKIKQHIQEVHLEDYRRSPPAPAVSGAARWRVGAGQDDTRRSDFPGKYNAAARYGVPIF